MKIIPHTVKDIQIVEVTSEELIIKHAEDGLDLLGNLYYQGFDKIIIHQQNIIPAFFDLKNGMAGEILQKFSNYRVRLTIIGDFSAYQSKSIKDFIYESNKGNHINFLSSTAEALSKLAG
ncbi:alpha/beta hydrolase [Pedobacter sp. Leaf216]|uniref:DUF4180 domain-containing protein n=1 Tax=Pedobacter sp. Leaf216 TaxID=1735684 RepID=UPI0006FC1AE3|nr:DUF4180 domain-containing protein [Pedobacter sp. Leaf216]KQM74913.1 alpha/beta hydrolase [Pedobacter sp. Leaf216]